MFPDIMVQGMRDELTRVGFKELRTPEEVDAALKNEHRTALVVVNSVCGCAAGRARPAVGMALKHAVRPAKAASVFAGGDEAAVAHLRNILSDYPPSSPSMALFQDGKPVYMIHRSEIERREPVEIAQMLTQAFDRICGSGVATSSQRV